MSQVRPEELDKVRQLVSALSPNARQFPATKGAIPMRRDQQMFIFFQFTDVSMVRTLLPADPVDLDMPACFGRKKRVLTQTEAGSHRTQACACARNPSLCKERPL